MGLLQKTHNVNFSDVLHILGRLYQPASHEHGREILLKEKGFQTAPASLNLTVY